MSNRKKASQPQETADEKFNDAVGEEVPSNGEPPAQRKEKAPIRMPAPGDPCNLDPQVCTGRLSVMSTFTDRREGIRTQYLICRTCGKRPENYKRVTRMHYRRA